MIRRDWWTTFGCLCWVCWVLWFIRIIIMFYRRQRLGWRLECLIMFWHRIAFVFDEFVTERGLLFWLFQLICLWATLFLPVLLLCWDSWCWRHCLWSSCSLVPWVCWWVWSILLLINSVFIRNRLVLAQLSRSWSGWRRSKFHSRQFFHWILVVMAGLGCCSTWWHLFWLLLFLWVLVLLLSYFLWYFDRCRVGRRSWMVLFFTRSE